MYCKYVIYSEKVKIEDVDKAIWWTEREQGWTIWHRCLNICKCHKLSVKQKDMCKDNPFYNKRMFQLLVPLVNDGSIFLFCSLI